MEQYLVDKNFEELLQEKQQALRARYSYEYIQKIKLDAVLKMSYFIADLEPDEEIEKHKKNIIDYLNLFVEANQKYSETEIILYRHEYLSLTIHYLNTQYGFHSKNVYIYSNILFGTIIDVVLILVGVAYYYYYIPIITLIFLIHGIIKQRKLKNEGKILDI